MKIEKLNEDKIKITLSIDDLLERNIDFHSFVYNSPESQDMFWDMIQEAEREYGFNIDESMVYVEAAASNSGTFTLIVSKSTARSSSLPNVKGKIKKGEYKLKRKNLSLSLKNNIYCFSSFEDICSFCKLIDITKINENTLYSINDVYYLQISNMPFNFILEYAEIAKSPDILISKLSEYGKIVIKDTALQTIHKHFCKKTRKKKLT